MLSTPNTDDQTLPQLLRSIRSSAFVLLLLLARSPLTLSQVARALHASLPTARMHLQRLVCAGLVTRLGSRGGYLITERFYSLLQITKVPGATEQGSGDVSQALGGAGRERQAVDPQVIEVLKEIGVMPGPRVIAAARLSHVTPKYIRAHWLQLKAQGQGDDLNLLLTRLESAQPAPELKENGHLKDCHCILCRPVGKKAVSLR